MPRVLIALAAAAVFAAPAAAAGDLLAEVNARRSGPVLVRDAALEAAAADCTAQMIAADTAIPCADVVGAGPDPATLASGWWDFGATRSKLDDGSKNRGGAAFDVGSSGTGYGAVNLSYVAPSPTPKPSPKPAARRSVRRSAAQASSNGSGTTPEKNQSPVAIPTPSPTMLESPPERKAEPTQTRPVAREGGAPGPSLVRAAPFLFGGAAALGGAYAIRRRLRRPKPVDLQARLSGPGSSQ